MSIVKLFHDYVAMIHEFCMHSDWHTGYIAKYRYYPVLPRRQCGKANAGLFLSITMTPMTVPGIFGKGYYCQTVSLPAFPIRTFMMESLIG
jgi:hypothetical protein